MAHPRITTPRHLRRTKLVGAFAFSLLVGIGSYTVTYHVLSVLTEPVAVVGVATPAVTQSHDGVHAVTPQSPATR
jgi:hypothetical protein